MLRFRVRCETAFFGDARWSNPRITLLVSFYSHWKLKNSRSQWKSSRMFFAKIFLSILNSQHLPTWKNNLTDRSKGEIEKVAVQSHIAPFWKAATFLGALLNSWAGLFPCPSVVSWIHACRLTTFACVCEMFLIFPFGIVPTVNTHV